MKRKIFTVLVSLAFALSLIFCLGVVAFAEGAGFILSDISITVEVPQAGEESTAGQFFSNDEFSASIGWSTTQDGSDLNDFNYKPFVAGETYYADIYITAKDNCQFEEGTTVRINGTPYTASFVSGSGQPRFIAVYDVPFTVKEVVVIIPADIYVGGIAVTDENAADILADGKACYDKETKTLTLNGAAITGYNTVLIGEENGYAGLYSKVKGLKINLVGTNEITFEDEMNDSFTGIYSSDDLEICGEGSLAVKAFNGVMSFGNLLVENCKITFSNIGLSGMRNITVNGATLAAGYCTAITETGDITVKNTTVTEGGIGATLMTETGKMVIEDSKITSNSEEGALFLNDALTIKNSTLDIKSGGSFGIFCGELYLEGTKCNVTMNCDAGYAIYAANIKIKNCEIDISIVATSDSAMGIVSAKDVKIEDSTVNIDVRCSEETAIAIGTMGGVINISNTTAKLVAKSDGAYGLYAQSINLTDCNIKIDATAIAQESFSAGILSEGGSVKLIGGKIDITVSGPVLDGHKISSGINMTNELLCPEFVGVDLMIKAPVAMTSAPYLTLYGEEYVIEASENVYGDNPVEYDAENIKSYKFFYIHGLEDETEPGNPPEKNGLGTGAIIGIVAGGCSVGGIGIFCLIWFVIKKKSFADLIAIFVKK